MSVKKREPLLQRVSAVVELTQQATVAAQMSLNILPPQTDNKSQTITPGHTLKL